MKLIEDNIIEKFDNGQMLLHFGEVYDAIDICLEDSITVNFRGNTIEVTCDVIKFVFAYFELEQLYKLESEMLIEVVILRSASYDDYYPKGYLKAFFTEVYLKAKEMTEYKNFRKNIVWLKK
jgi:hypothetical protein